MEQEEFVIKVLEVLYPMPDVSAIKAKGHIALYKEGVMFGKIIEQSVLLLNLFWVYSPQLATSIFSKQGGPKENLP